MKYGIDYYENMLRIYSKTAEEICRIRWDWIGRLYPKVVLDYGSGVGWFRAFRPEGVEVYSYDIGEVFPQTGIPLKMYDVICLWDVLEHIPDFSILEPVFGLSKAVAGTIPIKPESVDYLNWKHFKPNEHLHYWDKDMLDKFFTQYGFKSNLGWNQEECPPRQHVWSFLYER